MRRETWMIAELAESARNHQWPLAGGTLNQTQSFYEAHTVYLNSQSILMADLAKRK